MEKVKARTLSGFMELLPRQQAQFERVKGVLEETYARYGFTPLDTPHISLENGTQTVKMQFATFPQKIQNRCNLHPCVDEKLQRFSFCLTH